MTDGKLLKDAREAARRGDWAEAFRLWDGFRTQFPGDPMAHFYAAHALRHARRLDEAEALMTDAIAHFPEHGGIAIEHARIAAARHDWSEALRRSQRVRTQFRDRVDAYIVGAEALRSLGRSQEAKVLLDDGALALTAAKSAGLDRRKVLQMQLELAKARNDWQSARRTAEELLNVRTDSPAQTLLALARACWHLKDLPAAESAALRALAVDPMLVEAALIGAWVTSEQGDGEKLLHYYRNLAQIQPNNPRWSLQGCANA